MAWKAFLQSVQENPTPNDTVNAEIKFEDLVQGKSFTKTYNLHATNFQDLQTVKDMVLGELQKLNQFDSVIGILKPLVGKEIK